MKRYELITPEGTRDLLYEECLARRSVENKLRSLFTGFGYSEVITPGIEFFDVFSRDMRMIPQENLYKLTDSKGRLITLRPDSTIPIARVVATRLKSERLPIKLFYMQNIFLNNPLLSGQSDEICQAGIELIGSASRRADLEVITTAISVLSSYSEDFSVEIGDIGFFKELVSKLGADDLVCEEIRRLIEVKNYPALNDLLDGIGDNEAARALKQLPRLFGKEEVFEKARALFPESTTLENLKNLYTKLSGLGYNGKITCDLGIVNRTDYYTGVVFRGYIHGWGEAILSGGRYDKLISEFGNDLPATGFAINCDAVAKLLRRTEHCPVQKTADCIVYGTDGFEIKALKYSHSVSCDGMIVENSAFDSLEETIDYAKCRGIKKVIEVSDEIKGHIV